MSEGLRCQWIRATGHLEELEPQWTALYTADQQATPFQSPQWLLPWWEAFGTNLRTIAMHREDRLIGLLPFYLYRDRATGERKLLPLGVGTSDYLDGVFAPECGIEDIGNALDLLCSEEDWDALYISQLRPGSKLRQAFERWAPDGGTISGEGCSRMPAVRMSELPQKIRRNAMYYRNRALRAGSLELAIADECNCDAAYDALQRLHTEEWRVRGQSGVLADERVVRWHREALPLLARAGLLRLCSLRLSGETIGVIYSLIDPPQRAQRTQYFYITAYSVNHADLRPGTVLIALATEHGANEGVRTIDMLRGEEEYKKLWHMERMGTFGLVQHRQALRRRRQPAEMAA